MQPITDIAQLDLNGSYTYADYLLWQFQERLELIKGHIFKMAAPNPAHQRISSRLHGHLFIYLKDKKCDLFAAPFDVRLINARKSTPNNEVTTVVQPDICIICDPAKIDKRGCIGAPDLIVEILSTSTAKYDLNEKFDLYQESGVKEYWVVFPSDKAIMLFVLGEDEQYDKGTLYSIDDDFMLCSKTIEGLQIDLKLVFDSVN